MSSHLLRAEMLQEMGISPLWVLKSTTSETVKCMDADCVSAEQLSAIAKVIMPAPSESAVLPDNTELGDVWSLLEQQMRDCQRCALGQHRHQAVVGVGDKNPQWLFIGEAPGADEDAQGEPFVGQAGRLLNSMLAALGLKRGEGVYIANTVKCRPPGNRTPEAGEMAACKPFLLKQIELLSPKLIVLLGKSAVHSVLGEEKPLGQLRQQRFSFGEIPVVVTYHPAYLLRNLPDKAKAWEDRSFARRCLLGS